jgi:hypothetical protein
MSTGSTSPPSSVQAVTACDSLYVSPWPQRQLVEARQLREVPQAAHWQHGLWSRDTHVDAGRRVGMSPYLTDNLEQ